MRVVVTGAGGFIGRNFMVAAKRRGDLDLIPVTRETPTAELDEALRATDVVVHLAGVNRPEDPTEFERVNAGLTQEILAAAARAGTPPRVVFASSSQAALDNPYGISKQRAETHLEAYSAETGAAVAMFRLPGVFGKWSRPNYNSVVATFAHNIARGLPVDVHDPDREIHLVYVDDVVRDLLAAIDATSTGFFPVDPVHRVRLGELRDKFVAFSELRSTLRLPDLSDEFDRKLYATFISFLPPHDLAYALQVRSDPRGSLAEVLKSPHFGQIFVSRTFPGITRGNHYHDTKVEKFFVVKGKALITFRHIESREVIEYEIRGSDFKVVDIPPGYTHAIRNVGDEEMIVLFWADETFEPERPDTHPSMVSLA